MWNIILNDKIAFKKNSLKNRGPLKINPLLFSTLFSSSSTLVCQTDSGVEQASEAKSEPKPAPVENGLSHTLSVTPKPASQLNTQPQSTGKSTKFMFI